MNDRPEGWAHSTNQRSLPGPIEESRVKGKVTLKGYLSPILPANQIASTLEPGVRIVFTLELEATGGRKFKGVSMMAQEG